MESEHPIGLLFNGTQLRLVHAPRGESSGPITLPLEPMAEVAGRPMLGALELLPGLEVGAARMTAPPHPTSTRLGPTTRCSAEQRLRAPAGS